MENLIKNEKLKHTRSTSVILIKKLDFFTSKENMDRNRVDFQYFNQTI